MKSLTLRITFFLVSCGLGMTQELAKGRNEENLDFFVSCWSELNGLDQNEGIATDAQIDVFLKRFRNPFVAAGVEDVVPISRGPSHDEGYFNAWLEVTLVGTSNRSAIGANIRVLATIGGRTFWQLRSISSVGGAMIAHFGLGDATNVNAMRIEWPSGTVQELHNVAAKQILTITEPLYKRSSSTDAVPQLILNGPPALGSSVLIAGSPLTSITHTNLSVIDETVAIDTNATAPDRHASRGLSP